MSRVIRNKEDLDNTIKVAAHRLVIIQFTAKWCGPSQMISSSFESMRKEFPQYTFVRVDVDQTPDIAKEYDIKSIPTFVFVKHQVEQDRFSEANEVMLRQYIVKYRSTY